ncbi:acetyl-CoA synthetase [Elusimicrobium posterum]|uniref:AMP-binding protein n=1 Tax=Elusimicrobium posterum TaxID=3116653 RepID=UPI003C70B7B3
MLADRYVRTDFNDYEDFAANFKINVPENYNFGFDTVDEMARINPDREALNWHDESGKHQNFSFKDISEQSNKAANYLKSLGIKKGDRVMLIMQRKYEFWFVNVALCKIGAICIPSTHLMTVKDVVYRIKAAGIKAIVAVNDPRVIETVDAASKDPESKDLEIKVCVHGNPEGWKGFSTEYEKCSNIFERPTGDEATTNDDTLLLYFTSGTTGMPKMVCHSNTYPLGHIVTAYYWHNLRGQGTHLTLSDTGWGKCAWGKLYGQWICGNSVFVYDFERFVAADLLKIMADNKVTSFCAPPTVFRHMIKEDFSKYDLSALKYATVAGEPLNPEVFNKFKELTGISLMEGFGQTETTLMVANFFFMPNPKPGSMGKPNPTFDVDVIDENGNSTMVGEEGELVIRTDKGIPVGLFSGYYRDEELKKSVWYDNIYHTGDMVYRDEDGYYWFIGRADDVIKSSGYRIGPFEVESALVEHPAVLECAITAVPDEDKGQIVKASVILTKGYTPSPELVKELQNHVKKVTAPYKYPRIIEFVDDLPKTISGKIKRAQIRTEGENK